MLVHIFMEGFLNLYIRLFFFFLAKLLFEEPRFPCLSSIHTIFSVILFIFFPITYYLLSFPIHVIWVIFYYVDSVCSSLVLTPAVLLWCCPTGISGSIVPCPFVLFPCLDLTYMFRSLLHDLLLFISLWLVFSI